MPNLEDCLQLIWECRCVPNCMRKKLELEYRNLFIPRQ